MGGGKRNANIQNIIVGPCDNCVTSRDAFLVTWTVQWSAVRCSMRCDFSEQCILSRTIFKDCHVLPCLILPIIHKSGMFRCDDEKECSGVRRPSTAHVWID